MNYTLSASRCASLLPAPPHMVQGHAGRQPVARAARLGRDHGRHVAVRQLGHAGHVRREHDRRVARQPAGRVHRLAGLHVQAQGAQAPAVQRRARRGLVQQPACWAGSLRLL